MKKRKIISILLTAFVTLIALSSCKHENVYYYYAYMTTVVSETGQYPRYFITDDSIRLNPLNYNEFEALQNLKMNDRFIGRFTVPDEKINVNPINAEITAVNPILTKDIVFSNNLDTLGRDGIKDMGMWQSGGIDGLKRFVTLIINFYTSNTGTVHKVNLVRDTRTPATDEEGYYCLEFRHDANNDGSEMEKQGTVSFVLTDEMTSENIKGLKVTYKDIMLGEHTLTLHFAN